MEAARIGAALIGDESLLIECGDRLRQRGHAVRRVVTNEAAVRQWAVRHAIPVSTPSEVTLADDLRQSGIDYLFSIANLARVPDDVLAAPRVMAINFHDGPLPRYAGLNAPAWALMDHAREYGVTWHVMTAAIDAGDIVKQARFGVAPDDTALTLNLKCYQAAIDTFSALLEDIEQGRVVPVPQDAGPRVVFGRHQRPSSAGLLSFEDPADQLDALTRALDFGAYKNPLALPKILGPEDVLTVGRAEPQGQASVHPPGTVVAVDPQGMTVATATADVRLHTFRTPDGRPLDSVEAAARAGTVVGARLRDLSAAARDRVTALNAQAASAEGFWVQRLRGFEPSTLPQVLPVADPEGACMSATHDVPPAFIEAARQSPDAGTLAEQLVAAFAVYVARASGVWDVKVAWLDERLSAEDIDVQRFFAADLPAAFDPRIDESFATWAGRSREELRRLSRHQPPACDLPARYPGIPASARHWTVAVSLAAGADGPAPPPAHAMTFRVTHAAHAWSLIWREEAVTREAADAIARQFTCLLSAVAQSPSDTLGALPLVTGAEHERLVRHWNATERPLDGMGSIHELIASQCVRTPDATAIVFRNVACSYQELDERSNQIAHRLRALGVGPDVRVAVCLERSPDLVIAALGVLKAGGAYVPIDPQYPVDRTTLVLDDAEPAVVITERALESRVGTAGPPRLVIDRDRALLARESSAAVESGTGAAHLAYVIYTSGSTGRPKGVMVEHRNVVNFVAAMDERLGTVPGVWLAVTSLSFDISVLELFWTLARGFTVVLSDDEARTGVPHDPDTVRHRRPADFSLFYFAADAAEQPSQKYRLLLEGAKFADAHGFTAVWTPERHFHEFGGLYPNPAVAAAAIATITERIQIRAGSVVLPLHHPARVAEEWAVVDNLSGGRVAVSFASGWQPNDFVLRPENFQDSKAVLMRDLEIVRRLWRGEAVTFPGPKGDVEVRILPRPVQPELPVWLTSAGNPETFAAAGTARAFVLTHLLGQSIGELRHKIDVYRQAWRRAGHAGDGYVTLMLHTFVGESEAEVKATVRGPLMAYLRSAAGLMRQYASTFPAFRRRVDGGADADSAFASLSAAEMEDLLAFAADRYCETSGLLGTRDQCLETIAELRAAGVDELACLIDFGVPSELVLQHLHALAAVKEDANRSAGKPLDSPLSYSAAALIRRHGVTHVQCTPSQARIWLADAETRTALGSVKLLLVGGEALAPRVADELTSVVGGRVINMYGPTETTVWSSTHAIAAAPVDGATAVPIGRPIANTQLYVLDPQRQLVPIGLAGELYIAGAGVARGYLKRPDLTADRFVPDRFSGEPGARMYRTGDLVRYRPDGVLEFLGRLDHQVKLRGHRIELGEIETRLSADDRVSASVVLAREDAAGETRLVAYVASSTAASVADRLALSAALKTALRGQLPDVMVPAHVVVLDSLPQTPNGKIDRQALPAPASAAPTAHPAGSLGPRTELERQIASIWCDVLGCTELGVRDNFFDLGGDSLLAVQAHRRLRETVAQDVALTDLFRFPTIRTLAEHLSPAISSDAPVAHSGARAEMRRELMRRRHAG